MAYRPPAKVSEYIGERGLAKVALNGNKSKAKVVIVETGKEFVVSVKDCSKEVQEYIKSGEFVVSMSNDGDKIYSMYPYNGMFEGKVAKFSSKKDQPPAPLTKIGQNQQGQTYSYLFFVVMIEIASGEFKGMQVPLFLRYNFEAYDVEVRGETKKATRYNKTIEKSKHTAFLDEFMEVAGIWDAGAIPFSDNVLPKLEQRALRAAKTFKFIVKKGFLDTFYQETSIPEPVKEETKDEFGATFDADDLTDDPTEDNTEDKFE